MFWLQMILLVMLICDLFCVAILANDRTPRKPYNAYTVLTNAIMIAVLWLCGGFSTFFPSPLAP